MSSAEIKKAASAAIAWCDPEDEKDPQGCYWLNAYRGARVYRLIVKDRRIIGSIEDGFYGSNPYLGLDKETWRQALIAAVEERVGKGCQFLKADGSGTYFYLRNHEDAQLLDTRVFEVPQWGGGLHRNIEVQPLKKSI